MQICSVSLAAAALSQTEFQIVIPFLSLSVFMKIKMLQPHSDWLILSPMSPLIGSCPPLLHQVYLLIVLSLAGGSEVGNSRTSSGRVRRRSAPPGTYSAKLEAEINNKNMQ